MVSKIALLALAVGTFVAVAPRAQAFVAYTVGNPAANNFILFTYNSPGFITTDTAVPAADLAYFSPPPIEFISGVEFIPSSSDPAHLGLPEVDVFQYGGGPPQSFTGNQFRWYPLGTFTQYGVTPGLGATPGFPNSQSFGFPNSQLVVAAPEPSAIGLLGAGLFGLLALRRRSASL